jgi:hypothetical protein
VVAARAPFNSVPLTHRSQLLSVTPPYNGGLLTLSFGLFHQQEVVRDLTVDLFTQLRMFPVSLSIIKFSQALNHFQQSRSPFSAFNIHLRSRSFHVSVLSTPLLFQV